MNIFFCGPLCVSATGSCARNLLKLLATGLIFGALPAYAAGTLAGTDINNEASVDYQVGATSLTQTSNTVTVTVAELVDLTITLQSPQTPSAPGATNQELLFSLTNTGNGNEVFSLLINNALAGDDFDPVQSATALFFDTDGSGDLSAGDRHASGPCERRTGAKRAGCDVADRYGRTRHGVRRSRRRRRGRHYRYQWW